MPDGVFSFSPGVGSLSLLQGIFPTQGLSPGLPHCRQILYQLPTREAPLSPKTPYSKLFLHCPAQSLQTTLSSLILHMAPWHWQEFGRSLPRHPPPRPPWTWLYFCRSGAVMAGEAGVAKGKDRLLGFCQLSPENSILSARSSIFIPSALSPPGGGSHFLATNLWEITSSHLPPALRTPPDKLPISQSTSFAS